MLYLNATGKLFLLAAGAMVAAGVVRSRSEEVLVSDSTYGLPRWLYDELSGYVWSGDRGRFLTALDRAGAPGGIDFRQDLWRVLGGR